MSDERVLVDRDDLRAVLPTMKAPDPYFQPAEHDEWLAAFKRVQATLDAGVPAVEGEGEELTEVQQEPEDAGRRLMRSTQRDQREAYRAGKRGVTPNACGFTPAAHSSDELRDRIAEALWRHDAQIDFPQVGWACEATTYEKTIRRKEADAVLAVLREEGLLP